MRRRGSTTSPTLGRLRAPILALLAGVGLLVQGAEASRGATVGASLSPGHAAGATALHPASGLPTLLALGEGRLTGRSSGSRAPVGSGGGAWGHEPPEATRSSVPGLTHRAGALGSPAASAASVFARDALGRSGRLSAPSTAPPTSPF